MSAIRIPSSSFLSAFLPIARASLFPHEQVVQRTSLLQHLQRLRLKANLLPAALLPIPLLLGELWDGVLKAVPKKKTSHMKKRHRQMAGKALKDVTALNKCSACGRLKRAHILCPYCVQSIRQWFSNGFKSKDEVAGEKKERFERWNMELREQGKKSLKWNDVYGDDKKNVQA